MKDQEKTMFGSNEMFKTNQQLWLKKKEHLMILCANSSLPRANIAHAKLVVSGDNVLGELVTMYSNYICRKSLDVQWAPGKRRVTNIGRKRSQSGAV